MADIVICGISESEVYTNPVFDDDVNVVVDQNPPDVNDFWIEVEAIDTDNDDDNKKRGSMFNGASNRTIIIFAIKVFVIVLYSGYFCWAMFHSFGDEASLRLLVVTVLVLVGCATSLLLDRYGENLEEHCVKPITLCVTAKYKIIKWTFITVVLIVLVLILVLEVGMKDPRNLVSLLGIVIYCFLFYIFSTNRREVRWRPVLWGLGLQFVFALLILRTFWGYSAFKWLGERVSEFLAHTDAGAIFVFGEKYTDHFFAFKILPVVIFFSSTISILYYLGWMEVVIRKVAWVMQKCMGTTAAESLNAAANIFIGMSEAPLLIQPLIQNMTKSELHAVCTGGFATIAGSVMAAYIGFGVPANHLLSASVMSAPAALAMSKLFWPETEKSVTRVEDIKMDKPTEKNILEAASNGASQAIILVASIAANIIAFIALLAFVNATLNWMGERIGYPGVTFEFLCSYLLWPFSYVMGVDRGDCRLVAQLIGTKTFLNEFVAYKDLGVFIENRLVAESYFAANYTREQMTFIGDNIFLNHFNKTLIGGYMSLRSEAISTYALCGFSNFGSMGIVLGTLGAMAPQRKSDISQVVFRAMIAGNVACFMTACIAGLLFDARKGTLM